MDNKRIDVHVHELTEFVDYIASLQAEIDMFNSFARDVLISVLVPDQVRLFIEDDYSGSAAEAMDDFSKHMHKYRKILEFLRINNIDVNKITADTESKDLS